MKRKRRTTTAVRERWRKEHAGACMAPGCRNRSGLQIHEIIGGFDRAHAIQQPTLWLMLCPEHHDQFGSRPNQEQLVRQLSWKMYRDAESYCLDNVLHLWRPNCTLAFVEEIRLAVKLEYLRIVREIK